MDAEARKVALFFTFVFGAAVGFALARILF